MKLYIKDFKKRITAYIVVIITLFIGGIACITYGSLNIADYNKKIEQDYQITYAEFVGYKKNGKSNKYSMEYKYIDSQGNTKIGRWEKLVVGEEYANELIGHEILLFYNDKQNIQITDYNFNITYYAISIALGIIMLIATFVCSCRVVINFRNKKLNKNDNCLETEKITTDNTKPLIYDKKYNQINEVLEYESNKDAIIDGVDNEVIAEKVPEEKWRKLLENKSTIFFHTFSIIIFAVWFAFLFAFAYSTVTTYKKNMSANYQPAYATFTGYDIYMKHSTTNSALNDIYNSKHSIVWYQMNWESKLPSGKKYKGFKQNIPLNDELIAKSLVGKKILVFVDPNLNRVSGDLDFSVNGAYLPAILSLIPAGFIINAFFWIFAYSYAIIKDKTSKKINKNREKHGY